jgi:DNA-binding MarR family transcriptional regulator
MTELTTLSYLYQSPPMSPSELADLNKIKTQSMSQALARLESAKLIQRTASREDKRKVGVSLTPLGKKMIEQSRYERDEWLAEAIRNTLSEKESKALAAVIPLLRQIADVD